MQEALAEALEISFVGVTIVFSSLILVSLTLMLLNRVTMPRPARDEKPAQAADAVGPAAPEVPPDLVVVLAAAASSALGRRVRVRHVRYHGPTRDPAWLHRGRASVLGSHRVRQ